MNKLGIAYNIFDGEDILKYSLENLRKIADYIVVVYQEQSNFGNWNPNLLPALRKYQANGLIDRCYKYTPDIKYDDNNIPKFDSGIKNELEKRNIGLTICRENNCKWFMSLDCDELYDLNEFSKAFEYQITNNIDVSFSKLYTFYKSPIYQIFPIENYLAPFIYKIKSDNKFEEIEDYPVYCDHTRRMKFDKYWKFNQRELMMYHYAYVRNNISLKVNNSSARTDSLLRKMVIHHYENWNDKQKACFIGMQKFDTVKVPNKFKIEINI